MLSPDISSIAQYGVAALSIYLMYRIIAVYIKKQNQLIDRNTQAINELSRLIEKNTQLLETILERCRDGSDPS